MRYIALIILTFFSSCRTEKKEYYESGQIKSIEFASKVSSYPEKKINYYLTGEVKDTLRYDSLGNLTGRIYSFHKENDYYKWTEYLSGKANGKSTVFKADGSKIIQYFKDDKLYGIEEQNYPNGFQRQVCWLNDKPLFYKEIKSVEIGDTLKTLTFTQDGINEIIQISDDKYILESVFKVEKDKSLCIGSLQTNETGIIRNSLFNSYVKTSCKEQYNIGEPVKICLEGFFGNFKDIHIQVEVYELSDTLCSTSNNAIYTSMTDELKVCFNVKNPILGYNLTIGKVQLFRDEDLLHETYFFKDFLVCK